ncbi:MAG: TRAP transporter small permease [Desulfobacula sp.]|nr:TRAP transporter small permease [Desulfobacula sp.]
MGNKPTSFFRQIVMALQKIEDGILVGLLLVMIFMAVSQIFMRNLFDSGILWGDALVRVLVLWIGLMGAMIASRNNHHISIDILSKYLPEQIKKITNLVIFIFTSLICGVMAYFSLNFVIMEKQDSFMAFAAIPAWVCESIIPIAFAIISLRYIFLSLTSLANLFKPGTQ